MNKKMMIKILKNGPDKDSPEELKLAAWLIENGLAKGKFLPNYRASSSPPLIYYGRGQRFRD